MKKCEYPQVNRILYCSYSLRVSNISIFINFLSIDVPLLDPQSRLCSLYPCFVSYASVNLLMYEIVVSQNLFYGSLLQICVSRFWHFIILLCCFGHPFLFLHSLISSCVICLHINFLLLTHKSDPFEIVSFMVRPNLTIDIVGSIPVKYLFPIQICSWGFHFNTFNIFTTPVYHVQQFTLVLVP